MITTNHFLSVIVPIYKQEKTIQEDISQILNTLSLLRYDFELIAVVDGINVDNSYKILKKINNPKLIVTGYLHNKGKGNAVRFGMAKSKGDYVAFIDSGMDIDPNGISMLIEHLEWYKADIIIASKNHPASMVVYPLQRKILSLIVQTYMRLFLGLKITDSQAGLKLFKRKVLVAVLPRLLVKNFAIDLEILSVAKYLGFDKIYEAPIKLKYDFKPLTHSSTNLKAIKQFAIDALAIFYRIYIKRYYRDNNYRQWVFDPELKMRVNTGQ